MNTDRHGQNTGGMERGTGEGIIPKHGGYRRTKTWQLADLIYDVTVRFCDKFVDRRSRTTASQMVQAARSGVQNLQEASVDSAISKKLELKLTGTARGSLMELQRDYRKFLQHHGLPEWPPDHPALVRFRALRCATLEQFRAWVAEEVRRYEREHTDTHGRTRAEAQADVRARPCAPVPPASFRGLRRQWRAGAVEPVHILGGPAA
ncbi:MAG: four helix bundle protein [Verrucomicrobiales bacterium]|nr:four helix bundle protein [Verrucomicrobiales bacterium]